jgi:hypothetical protein
VVASKIDNNLLFKVASSILLVLLSLVTYIYSHDSDRQDAQIAKIEEYQRGSESKIARLEEINEAGTREFNSIHETLKEINTKLDNVLRENFSFKK